MGRKVVNLPPSTLNIVNIDDGWTVVQNASTVGIAVATGTLTADVYQELVSITGSGYLDFLTVISASSTSRTITVKVVVDGTTAMESVSGTVSTGSSYSKALIGWSTVGGGGVALSAGVRFNSSLSISLKNSVGGADLESIKYSARTE